MENIQAPNYPPPPPPPPTTSPLSGRPTTPRSGSNPKSSILRSTSKSSLQRYQPEVSPSPPLPPTDKDDVAPPPARRSSLGNLLRRTKSTDRVASKKGSKNASPVTTSSVPPRLPELPIQTTPSSPMKNFGASPVVAINNNSNNNSNTNSNNQTKYNTTPKKSVDSTAIRTGFNISEDPYQNVGSMANRGRYSYASSLVSTINGPRRLRKRKEPIPFNILVIGAQNSGKTSFLQLLKKSLSPKEKGRGNSPDQFSEGRASSEVEYQSVPSVSGFSKTYIETDMDGDRIGITLWDSPGLEKSIVDLQLRETVTLIQSKFEETFLEETKVSRVPGVKDSRIHCAFLLLDPVRLEAGKSPKRFVQENGGQISQGGLDEDLDLQVFRALQGKTTVIPVISKADTCTTAQMVNLKRLVVLSLESANLNPLESLDIEVEHEAEIKGGRGRRGKQYIHGHSFPELDEDYENGAASDSSSDFDGVSRSVVGDVIPLSIISPDHYGTDFVGREFPWGFADPYNSKHCDFNKLKEIVFTDWRAEMLLACKEIFYENWRTSRLSLSTERYTQNSASGLGRAI